MIKLIASDMDGTLLNQNSVVSDTNIAAIERANQQGIQFIVATGRKLSEAQPLLQALKQPPAFITLNGALVYSKDLQPVLRILLTNANFATCIQVLQKYDLYFEVLTPEHIYSTSHYQRIHQVAAFIQQLNPSLLYKKALEVATSRTELMQVTYISSPQELLNNPQLSIMKVIAYLSDNKTKFLAARHELQQAAGLNVTSSSANNMEINNQQAQKGPALAQFAQQQKIPLTQVMAIGDNLNDMSMIKTAGLGVAMGNAVPQIKQLAQYQTADNNQNGVAQAIDYALSLNASSE